MDYMYNACSTTARRGALDWAPKFYEANLPVFKSLYENVKNGNETRRSLSFNGQKDYREKFAEETAEIDAQEIWRAGKTGKSRRWPFAMSCSAPTDLNPCSPLRFTVRRLRPDYKEEL
jgi:ketol-acid reductoisomerase